MRHIAHYPGQHVHPMLAKTAVNFDFGDLTTINPDTGRFRSVVPEGGNPKYRGHNILELLEDALANEVSFALTVSYQEPMNVTVYSVMTGWSASVDASKEGWGLRLLEKAEAHDEDYMGKWLDENSDFSGYRASRKTAASDPIESYKIMSQIAKQCYEDFQQLQRNVEDASEMYLDHKDMYEPNVRVDSDSRFEKEDIERARSMAGWFNEISFALKDMPAKRFNSLMQHIQSQPYQSSRKTATGEMSEADLTSDGEWGFWVQVADAVGGTIHPFDKYQGPYIRYNGNRFWLQSDETGDFVYNETTDELRPISESFGDSQFRLVPAVIAEEIRDMARTSSRKTAEISSSKHRYWRSKG